MLMKARTTINRLSIIWKCSQSNKIKRDFFHAVILSKLLYKCTTWTLTKRIKKKLDGNNKRILRAILNKSWKQQPHEITAIRPLTSHLKNIQVKRARHAGHLWRSKDEFISNVHLWTPTHERVSVG